jgi:hypothetical protein
LKVPLSESGGPGGHPGRRGRSSPRGPTFLQRSSIRSNRRRRTMPDQKANAPIKNRTRRAHSRLHKPVEALLRISTSTALRA